LFQLTFLIKVNTSSLCTLENLFFNKVKIILKFGRFGLKKLEKGLELTRKIANKRGQECKKPWITIEV